MKARNNKAIVSFIKFKRKHPRLVMSTLVFLIIPLLASSVLGYEMQKEVAMTIPTVVMNSDNSQFSRDYLDFVEENEYFQIVDYVDNYEDVKKTIDEGRAFAGVIIPENFYKDMVEGKAPKIMTVYDGSTLAVIVTSKTAMSEILLTLKSAYLANVYAGKQNIVPGQIMNQIVPINVATRMLYNPAKNFRNFLLPGMLASIVQVAIALTGAERGYENQGLRIKFKVHLKRIGFWSLVGTCSILLTIAVQWIFFGLPLKGTLFGLVIYTYLFSMTITTLGYIVGSVLPERTFCSQIACILVLPTSILGGYTWPVLAMPEALQFFAKLIPFTYYCNDIRSICLKPLEIQNILPHMGFMIAFLAVEIIILVGIKHAKDKTAVEGEVASL